VLAPHTFASPWKGLGVKSLQVQGFRVQGFRVQDRVWSLGVLASHTGASPDVCACLSPHTFKHTKKNGTY
jgi:hypothetical protein